MDVVEGEMTMLQKLNCDIDFEDVLQWTQLVCEMQLVKEDEMQTVGIREDVMRWAKKRVTIYILRTSISQERASLRSLLLPSSGCIANRAVLHEHGGGPVEGREM